MANNTITLALNGDVPFNLFVEALQHLDNLVNGLTVEIGVSSKLIWYVDDLQPGSAVATMRGESEVEADVERIVTAYGEIGKSLESGLPVNYSINVINEAIAITNLINDNISSVRFETPFIDAMIDGPTTLGLLKEPRLKLRKTIGAVRGQIETISKHKGLRFNLFDLVHNRAISCYLADGQEGIMREMWGKGAIVEGEITRDSSGRPVSVRNITKISEATAGKRGSYLAARGISPRKDGDPMPEEVIRRLRDAS